MGRAVLIGAFLVVAILFLLLGDWKAAAIVTITIPLSMALAGILLRYANVGINTMTLGGLAIAVGILVDAAIIVTENIIHRFSGATTAAERHARALSAAVEVGRPIAFATLIVIAVFLPLFGMSGIEGTDVQAAGGGGGGHRPFRARAGPDHRSRGRGLAPASPRRRASKATLRSSAA